MGYRIERVNQKGETRHTAMYVDIKGKARSAGTFSTAKAADRAWQRAEAHLAEGKIGDPQRGRQTLRRYVEETWFPNHVIELSTREGYRYVLDRYILPELGSMRMVEIMPSHIRDWVSRLKTEHDAKPPTIRASKVILDSALTTALHDQVTFLHAGKGVKTPPIAKKKKRIVTAVEFERIHGALADPMMQLLVETDIESGLRWGELTELRPKDFNFTNGVLTVARAVIHLKAKSRPGGVRFVVKEYPKDGEWRQVKLADHLLDKLKAYIADKALGPDDLLFCQPQPTAPTRRTVPAELPDPMTLGWTDPNQKGRRYRHGTTTAYGDGKCRCEHCRNAVAAYRASRRAAGKDEPRGRRTVTTDGHIGNDWFRTNVWNKALATANLGFHVTPHGLRHAHASWLLAGGADLQVVKERLGHGSIATTEKYLHTLTGADDAALAALDSIRGNRGNAPAEDQAQKAELVEMRELVAKLSEMVTGLSDGKSPTESA